MKSIRVITVTALIILSFLIACQKEINFDVTPNNTGGSTQSSYGWSLTGNTSNSYGGCIDTAYIEMAGPGKILTIEGTDTTGNIFIVSVISPTGAISAGTYSAAQSTAFIIIQTATDIYSSPPGTFSIQVTAISDTLIQASFTGDLTPSGGGANFKITNGKLTARIGKTNPCGITGSGGSGGGGGGGTGNAVFSLVGTPGTCTNADVLGNYIRNVAVNSANTVELEVNVTVAGSWNITTSTVNGISFSGSGSLSTGIQTIVLNANGTPTLFGNNTIPVSAGSSHCSFIVLVDTIPAAPCNPTNNTANLQGVNNITFTSIHGTVSSGNYLITANGSSGDLHLLFPGPTRPAAGVYDLEFSLSNLNNGEVIIDFTASNIFWQASNNGQVHVTVNNNKVTAVFCSIPISGTLGGPGFNSLATGKITEQ